MGEVTITWSTGSRKTIAVEGLRYIVLGRSTTYLVYGAGHYTTSFVGIGHMGRQTLSSVWQDAEVLVRTLTGRVLLDEVLRSCPVLTNDQERKLRATGLLLDESDEIVFCRTSSGWESYRRLPAAA